ncbi:MAG: response regulator transcription factor [Deltaproteobacteria bacterium]|nr:response regulator transcription factor [Deltaproteobacteria bacterium]
MSTIKIFITDDHPIIRNGLKKMFSKDPRYKVVGEAKDGKEALEGIDKNKPDIIIMDISMPEMDGIVATKRIIKTYPDTKVIILSMHQEQQYAIDAFRAGAQGYVLKGSAVTELMDSIEKVSNGSRYASPIVANGLINGIIDMIQGEMPMDPFNSLTSREKEVLKLVAKSIKNKEIAEELFISVHTVKTHRANIMKKLNLHDTAGLVKIAIRRGLIEN